MTTWPRLRSKVSPSPSRKFQICQPATMSPMSMPSPPRSKRKTSERSMQRLWLMYHKQRVTMVWYKLAIASASQLKSCHQKNCVWTVGHWVLPPNGPSRRLLPSPITFEITRQSWSKTWSEFKSSVLNLSSTLKSRICSLEVGWSMCATWMTWCCK